MSEAGPEPKVPPESARTPVVGSRRRCPVCREADLTGLLGQVPPRAVPPAGAGRARSPESEDPGALGDGAKKAAGGAMPENTSLGDDNWPPRRAARRRDAAGPSVSRRVILQGGPYFQTVDGLREGLRELGLEEGTQIILWEGSEAGSEVRVRSTGYGLALFFFMLTQPTRKSDTAGQLPSHS